MKRLLPWFIPLFACSSEAPKTYAAYTGEPPYPNRREPLVLTSGGLYGVVSNSGSDTLDVIDFARNERIRRFPVGRYPIDIDGPHHLAVDAASGFLYTVLSYPVQDAKGPHAEHGSSQRLGYLQKLSFADFAPVEEIRIDTNPGDVVLSEDRSRVVVSHFDLVRANLDSPDRSAKIWSVSTAKLADSPVRIAACRAPHGLVLSRPDGLLGYAACYADDAIAFLDFNAGTSTLLPLGAEVSTAAPLIGPYSVRENPSGTQLAVGTTESKSLYFVDLETRMVRRPALTLQGAVYQPAWSEDGTELFVPTQSIDSVRVVRSDTGETLRSRVFEASECILPHEVAVIDTTRIAVVCEGDRKSASAVLVLDRTTLATLAKVEVGVYPDHVAIVRAP